MARKLDAQYYSAAKDILKEVTGLPKTVFEEVSSNSKEHFVPDAATLCIETWKKQWQFMNQRLSEYASRLEQRYKGCKVTYGDYDLCYVTFPKELLDSLFKLDEKPDHDTISFWAVTVFDTRNTFVAYGAKIKSTDGWVFPANLNQIQKRLGEKKFNEYCQGGNRSFKSYKELVNYLIAIDPYMRNNIPTEQKIIDSAYDERYFIH